MVDNEDLYLRLCDRYTAVELVDLLNLTVEDVWNAFDEQIMDNGELLETLGYDIDSMAE